MTGRVPEEPSLALQGSVPCWRDGFVSGGTGENVRRRKHNGIPRRKVFFAGKKNNSFIWKQMHELPATNIQLNFCKIR
jgi:hypothetical protein